MTPTLAALPFPRNPLDRTDREEAAIGSEPIDSLGLRRDLTLMAAPAASRRRMLAWLAIGGCVPLAMAACGGGGSDGGSALSGSSDTTDSSTGSSSDGSSSTDSTVSSDSCSTIPQETSGPYPADGTNSRNGTTVNALTLDGIVRSDITSSIGDATGVAEGVPLSVTLKVVNSDSDCTSLEGYAVYLWHCTREGEYSLYGSDVADENFLRGVQVTDANGEVTFETIFPGCYSGRMPHIHFEVYGSLAEATSGRNALRTSQLAFPRDICDEVYTTDGYTQSVRNFASITFASDNVFSDGVDTQLATIGGSVNGTVTAGLQVGVAA